MPAAEIIPRFFPGVPLRVPIAQMQTLVDISITETLGWQPQETRLFVEATE